MDSVAWVPLMQHICCCSLESKQVRRIKMNHFHSFSCNIKRGFSVLWRFESDISSLHACVNLDHFGGIANPLAALTFCIVV